MPTCWLTNFVIFVILKHVEALWLPSLPFDASYLPAEEKLQTLWIQVQTLDVTKFLQFFPKLKDQPAKNSHQKKKFASLLAFIYNLWLFVLSTQWNNIILIRKSWRMHDLSNKSIVCDWIIRYCLNTWHDCFWLHVKHLGLSLEENN